MPFKAVLLDPNVGFAPASNIGLAEARGRFIAFMNSDVFPGTLDWLERLSSHLAADPSIGVIGPVLLFEDGSVQHRGMFFSRLAEFGNWFFPCTTIRACGLSVMDRCSRISASPALAC